MEILAQICADGCVGEKPACHWQSLSYGNAKRISGDWAKKSEPSGFSNKREADSEHVPVHKITIIRASHEEELIDIWIEEVLFPMLKKG
jgi:hypothetical protein